MSEEILVLQLTNAQYEALKEVMILDEEPEAMVNNAKPTDKGFVLTGPWDVFDDLAGFVASEANHSESQKKQKVLDRICEKIEELL